MLLIILAMLIDLVLGDPQWFPHPVRAVGKLLSLMEKVTVALLGRNILSGTLAASVTIIATAAAVFGSLEAANHLFDQPSMQIANIAPELANWLPAGTNLPHTLLTIFWLWAGFSARELSKSAMQVYTHLCKGDIVKARKSLSMIVGRDTHDLDRTAISRATIETVTENSVDGIFSPLIFAFIGGPALLWAFKATSTCDSMIGYKDEKHILFGKFAARLDDTLNYIPARISLLLFTAAAPLCGMPPARCFKIAIRDAKLHASPNAGIPEAAAAGALGISLGGPASYDGTISQKEFFGKEFPPPEISHIPATLRLMWASTAILLAALTTGMRT
ncbi:MAG: cobalamin biosynthesis protein CobD [Victivallales bacterium]|nr:cobalamin biosynthesis protein CobD [Victivallales bacterium]